MITKVDVYGGGLAGSEAAYQLLKRGIDVDMYEMRPVKNTPCHSTENLAELVCSNSLKSINAETASGCLKAEMKLMDSLIIRCAESAAVPSGHALAVDRAKLSAAVEETLRSYKGFNLIRQEALKVNRNGAVIVATGPLTSDALSKDIAELVGKEQLYFYDAAAPIVAADSLSDKLFYASRYGKGGATDYLNAGMNAEQYETFYKALITAKTADMSHEEKRVVFEGCMPIEVMAKRGAETLRYAMLKPVGIRHPVTDEKYYAVVQLRKENIAATMYNLVGFQTNLTFGEQKRVFGLIPGLENAEFLRYGVMHRNTFIDSPRVLDETFKLKSADGIYFAGQMTGVEGYVESAMSGLAAAVNLYNKISFKEAFLPPRTTVTGSLMRYVSASNVNFQPMNANFGLLPPLETSVRDKSGRKKEYSARALRDLKVYYEKNGGIYGD